MPSGMYSDYLANKINDHISGVAVYTPPLELKVGLYTARGSIAQSCANTNFVAVSGGGYVEVDIGVGGTNWSTSALRACNNKLVVAMGTPSVDWGTAIGYTIKDQNNNLLWWADFAITKPCPAGVPVSWTATSLIASLPYGP